MLLNSSAAFRAIGYSTPWGGNNYRLLNFTGTVIVSDASGGGGGTGDARRTRLTAA